MSEDNEENLYPDGALVLVRYPLQGSGMFLQTNDREWPWLAGEIVGRCGENEWKVTVLDDRVAVLGDGLPAELAGEDAEVFHPQCFRGRDELMPRDDDQSEPDGEQPAPAPASANDELRLALALEHQGLVTKMSMVGMFLGQWAGRGDWAEFSPEFRANAGNQAAQELLNITAELMWLSLKLVGCGCAATHSFLDLAQDQLEGVTLPSADVDAPELVDVVGESPVGLPPTAGQQALAHLAAGEAVAAMDDEAAATARWASHFDRIMEFDQGKPTQVHPETSE